jgi:hypothetical protein
MMATALDLFFAFADFVKTLSVSMPALQFVGIILVAFLLGLLLGRITKRGVQRVVESSNEREVGRVLLDFERLTPLGPSKEEAAENSVMDISDLRSDQMRKESGAGGREEQQEPTSLKR